MAAETTPPLRQLLRDRLRAARRARDRAAVGALRSTIAAVDNAESVPVELTGTNASPTVAGAVTGLGSAEVPRRALSEHDVAAVIGQEVRERLDAAEVYDGAGRPVEAERLRAEAALLADLLP